MAALSERKIDIVRTLVQSAPDKVVGGLQKALASAAGDPQLARVLVLVEAEARDRLLRNLVLKPLVPLCHGDGRDPNRLSFPALALAHVWRGVKATASRVVNDVTENLEEILAGNHPTDSLNALAGAAAAGMRRGGHPDFQLAAEICEQARPGSAVVFTTCLELTPVMRGVIARATHWIGHMDNDTAAAARVAYNDATEIAAEAGKPFFEMLAAQLPQPWMVLRLISAVMDKPNERYMADSELAGFGERVIAEIDAGLAKLAAFDPQAGAEAAREMGKVVDLATRQMVEIEEYIDLNREHGWGKQVHMQRAALASAVERRLREADHAVTAVLPTHMGKGNKSRRQTPNLAAPPEPLAASRALNLLVFVEAVRTSVNSGGFAAARVKTIEKLTAQIDQYLDDVLDDLRAGEVAQPANAKAMLGILADFTAPLRDQKSADIIRRRAAAAFNPDGSAVLAR